MPQTTYYRPPTSGRIIGAVVDALGDRQGVLAERQARRYLLGHVVSPAQRRRCIDAVASQLISRKIVAPSSLQGSTTEEKEATLAAAIAWHAEQWDHLGSEVYGTASRIDDPAAGLAAYLRLVTVDISIRIVAALWLTGGAAPMSGTPSWAKESGFGGYLNELRRSAGVTRDALASKVSVSRQAVDGWLDGGARPKDEHLALIARALSGAKHGDVDGLEAELRRGYFLQELGDRMASAVSRGTTEFFATSLAVLVNWLLPFFSRIAARTADGNIRWNDQSRSVQWARNLAVVGATTRAARPLLKAMADFQGDREWKLAIQGAQTTWLGYLQLKHAQLGSGMLAGMDPSDRALWDEVSKALRSEAEAGLSALADDDPILAARHLEREYQLVRTASGLAPSNPWLHFQLGSFTGKRGDVDAGVKECWIAAKLSPDWELPLVEIGIMLINADRNAEARTHLERIALERQEPSWHLLFNLAEARRRCDDTVGALETYEQAMELHPNHALMVDRAAHCAFLGGDPVKGLRYAKRAEFFGSYETIRDWRAGKYRRRQA